MASIAMWGVCTILTFLVSQARAETSIADPPELQAIVSPGPFEVHQFIHAQCIVKQLTAPSNKAMLEMVLKNTNEATSLAALSKLDQGYIYVINQTFKASSIRYPQEEIICRYNDGKETLTASKEIRLIQIPTKDIKMVFENEHVEMKCPRGNTTNQKWVKKGEIEETLDADVDLTPAFLYTVDDYKLGISQTRVSDQGRYDCVERINNKEYILSTIILLVNGAAFYVSPGPYVNGKTIQVTCSITNNVKEAVAGKLTLVLGESVKGAVDTVDRRPDGLFGLEIRNDLVVTQSLERGEFSCLYTSPSGNVTQIGQNVQIALKVQPNLGMYVGVSATIAVLAIFVSVACVVYHRRNNHKGLGSGSDTYNELDEQEMQHRRHVSVQGTINETVASVDEDAHRPPAVLPRPQQTTTGPEFVAPYMIRTFEDDVSPSSSSSHYLPMDGQRTGAKQRESPAEITEEQSLSIHNSAVSTRGEVSGEAMAKEVKTSLEIDLNSSDGQSCDKDTASEEKHDYLDMISSDSGESTACALEDPIDLDWPDTPPPPPHLEPYLAPRQVLKVEGTDKVKGPHSTATAPLKTTSENYEKLQKSQKDVKAGKGNQNTGYEKLHWVKEEPPDMDTWLQEQNVSAETCKRLHEEMMGRLQDLAVMSKRDIERLHLPMGEEVRLWMAIKKLEGILSPNE